MEKVNVWDVHTYIYDLGKRKALNVERNILKSFEKDHAILYQIKELGMRNEKKLKITFFLFISGLSLKIRL